MPESDQTPSRQLTRFLSKYEPSIASLARGARSQLRRMLPGAYELVYDNYNALAIGFAPSDKTSSAVFSIAVYPRWVSLFFLQAAGIKDPTGLLKGSGKRVRHVVLNAVSDLRRPEIRALLKEGQRVAVCPIERRARGRLIIKSVSEKQRPRRAAKHVD
jgi:hypothetical protein